ncbi:MAG: alpha/beta hydrolase [Nitratireductor sp.]|nr:alpha/beta hydrolase [Nitratireductor sp.]
MQQWQDFTYSASDGLRLAGRQYGWAHRGAAPVVCLSGLSRNSADFHELALHLANHDETPRRVLTLDYRGRGKSAYDPNWENYSPVVEADDCIQGMTAAGLSHAHIVGTSRGGLIAMLLAGIRPGMMISVTLNDIGPELAGSGLVRIKKSLESDYVAESFEDAAERMKRAGERDFPKRSDADWLHHARKLYKENDGRKGGVIRAYDRNLARTLAAIDLDSPLPTLWPQFAGLNKHPVLLLRGANTDLLEDATVERMRQVHPGMAFANLPDEGHAPDVGLPGTAERIAAFLARAERE